MAYTNMKLAGWVVTVEDGEGGREPLRTGQYSHSTVKLYVSEARASAAARRSLRKGTKFWVEPAYIPGGLSGPGLGSQTA